MNRRMMPAVRFLEEKEGEGECKNQICHCCHHWDKGGMETLQLQCRGGMMLTQILPHARTWSWWTYDRQLEREVAQRRMRWKMMEEEWSWEEERIKARIAAMLMGMGMGTEMGMDNADRVKRCWQEEGRMMQEPSSDKGGS